MKFLVLLILSLLFSCSNEIEEGNLVEEPLEHWVEPAISFERVERGRYPWESRVGEHPRITKDFFRCRGSSLNPMRTVEGEDEPRYLIDCGGVKRHGLPLYEGEEGVYPILLDLLNFVQERTGKRVVVTCGHRCPQHNTYADPRSFSNHSKHMVGAEVDFYVQGMEWEPERVVELLMAYYAGEESSSYRNFVRYEKEGTDVSTLPWYNKEVFIKLYKESEGRDYDNRHPYPYIGVQVRYDRDQSEWVAYTWKAAHYNYRRE